jgi:signal transduction histidine kinase
LGRLFQDLLDISKADDGRLKNNPTIVDMVSSIRDITNGLDASAKAKNILLMYGPDTGGHLSDRITPLYYAYLDRDHLREVVSNLIENAIKYTPRGSVTVGVGGDNSHVVISVRDTGLGIPQRTSLIFSKNSIESTTQTRERSVELAWGFYPNRLTETMQGRIWVEASMVKVVHF